MASSPAAIGSDRRRTPVFAWYNLVGSFATAVGALCGGVLAQVLQGTGVTPLNSYRAVVVGYAVMGALLAGLFSRLTPGIEAAVRPGRATLGGRLGLHRSCRIVFKLSALFALDAFAGGLVVQSIVALWFHTRFGVPPGVPGAIFFGANVLAGVTGIERTTGEALSAVIAGPMLASSTLLGLPFVLAGVLKLVYDLLLYRSFHALKPPEETRRENHR
jgi:hypothetical protein